MAQAWVSTKGIFCKGEALKELREKDGLIDRLLVRKYGLDNKMAALVVAMDQMAVQYGLPSRHLAEAVWMALPVRGDSNGVFAKWVADVLTGKVMDGNLQYLQYCPETEVEGQQAFEMVVEYFKKIAVHQRASYFSDVEKVVTACYPKFPNSLERKTILDVAFWAIDMMAGKERHLVYSCRSLLTEAVEGCVSHDPKKAFLALEGHLLKLLSRCY